MTVRASLGQLFMRNWPIKLAALFFAIMLYVAVAAQQPLSQSFAMRLAIAIPPGRTVRQQPAGVTVVIAGTGSEILKLRSFPRVIRKVIPDTFSTSLWRIQLQAADVELPKGIGVTVADIRPRDIEILLDSVAHKDVRIVPRVKVEAESGYVLRGLSITPSLARLVGPEQSLTKLDSVTTLPTVISSVSGPFFQTVPIDTAPLGVVRISPKTVRMAGEVTAIIERSIGGVPITTAASGFTGFLLSPERVSVTVRGPASRVNTLTRDSVRVVAELVSRAHLSALPAVVDRALAEAGLAWSAVDAVAVTQGPGLVGALLVGVVFAKALAYAGDRELIGVHHMEGHLFAPALEDPGLAPPFVALLVSGGHTLLLDVPAWGRYRLLGATRDDAAGEAFDKVAALLGLGYPGGPAIERLASQGDPRRFSFPRPMRDEGYEFSFSGLKTAVLRAVRASDDLDRDRPHLARAFQDAVLDVLVTKLERAVRATGYRTAVLGGGVACNRTLVELAAQRLSGLARVAVASPRLNTDNAAMIARAGWHRLALGERSDWTLDARADLPLPGLEPADNPQSTIRNPQSR